MTTPNSQQWEAAFAHIKTLKESEPTNGRYQTVYGLLQIRRSDFKEALSSLQESLRSTDRGWIEFNLLGQALAHIHLEQDEQALNCYRTACEWMLLTENSPFHTRTLVELKSEIESLLRIPKTNLLSVTRFIDSQSSINSQSKEAIKNLNSSLRRNRKYDELARKLLRLKMYHAAIFEAGLAIESDPNSNSGYFWRGVALAKLHRFEQAVANLQRSLELRPNDAHAFQYLSWIYVWGFPDIRDADLGAKLAQQAIDLRPDDWQSWTNLAMAFYHQGRFSDSQEAVKKAISLRRNDAVPQLLGALCHFRQGRENEGCRAYEKSTQLKGERFLIDQLYDELTQLREED